MAREHAPDGCVNPEQGDAVWTYARHRKLPDGLRTEGDALVRDHLQACEACSAMYAAAVAEQRRSLTPVG